MSTQQESVHWPFVPSPLVAWTDLFGVIKPGDDPTRGRMRSLRDGRLVSIGIRVTHRGSTGMEGAGTFHSVLSAWAYRARAQGLTSEAESLARKADTIEATYGTYLRAFLTFHSLSDLPQADFYPRLVHDTAVAVDEVLSKVDVALGEVKQRPGQALWVDIKAFTRQRRSVEFPAAVLARKGIAVGDVVIVIFRPLGAGQFTEIEVAVPAPGLDEIVGGPPYDEAEYAELAARYRRGPGAAPDRATTRRVAAAKREGRVPRRPLTRAR